MTRADFNECVLQLSRKLYGFAFRLLQNQVEAEDAVQEVFIKLWKMGDKLDNYISIEALATTMTKNYCIDQLRKQRNTSLDYCLEKVSGFEFESSPSPYDQVVITESNDILHNIINNMPEGYKVVIILRDIDGMSYEEIAEKTDQNINTLRVTLSRARKFVRDEFNKYQHEKRGIKKTARKVL